MVGIVKNSITTKIFLLLEQGETKNNIDSFLSSDTFELMEANGEIEDILTQIHHFFPDIILVDSNLSNCDFVIRQIKSASKNQNAQIIMLLNDNTPFDVINMAEGFVQVPVKKEVLLTTINSHFKIKKSLDRLYENNKELSKSLYQLNVLYNTSSQFAGTLNTDKLYEIMIEAMEKTLSFDISSVLLFNSEKKPVFRLNTLHTPSVNLVQALKIRSVLNYESEFENDSSNIFPLDNIEVVQKTKQSLSNKVFSLESVSFDSLYAPVKIGDEIFGVVELFRQAPFTQEDVTCFQAIAHQVALPLRSAKLYEEISITNKKLEKLEKIKSDFISIVSHEIRTPLAPIDNALDILLNGYAGELSDDAKNFITMAKRNVARQKGIINDLLDLQKIETGKFRYEYKLSDITPSLELLKNTFVQVASEKNIAINLEIKEPLPEIYADTRRIEQIFTNLVSNALKFTADNGHIDVKAEIVDSSDIDPNELIMPVSEITGRYIKVCVTDNGIGIKNEDIPKIFDKFSQIESSLNRNKGGVGLGLTITKQLIDAHLGAISVESKEKEGSKFSVFLPLKDDKKIFKMNLVRDITDVQDIGIFKIEYNKNINLIDELKNQKLINLTPSCMELYIEKEDKMQYYCYIPKITFESFSALYNNLENYCSQKEGDITIIKAHTLKEGEKIKDILKI